MNLRLLSRVEDVAPSGKLSEQLAPYKLNNFFARLAIAMWKVVQRGSYIVYGTPGSTDVVELYPSVSGKKNQVQVTVNGTRIPYKQKSKESAIAAVVRSITTFYLDDRLHVISFDEIPITAQLEEVRHILKIEDETIAKASAASQRSLSKTRASARKSSINRRSQQYYKVAAERFPFFTRGLLPKVLRTEYFPDSFYTEEDFNEMDGVFQFPFDSKGLPVELKSVISLESPDPTQENELDNFLFEEVTNIRNKELQQAFNKEYSAKTGGVIVIFNDDLSQTYLYVKNKQKQKIA